MLLPGGVPERPIGSALKALAGSNVSRGFESRPLCLTNYRLDRRFVLPVIGLHLIAAALVAVLAFLVWAPIGVLLALLILNLLRILAWPPVVARADPGGLRLGGPLTVKPVRIAWSDVEDVSVDSVRLYVTRSDPSTVAFPLAYVGQRAPDLVREVYDRLNEANGYRRFDPEAPVA